MAKEQNRRSLTLGVLNLVACVLMATAFAFQYNIEKGYETVTPFLTYALPFLVIAILDLVGGIFALEGKNRAWAITGFVLSTIGLVYFLVLIGS
jgi:hypothetical protein